MKKKIRVVGTERFVNPSTGEFKDMQIVETSEYEKDSNFHKLFLKDFVSALELVANQKTKLCYWIITNLTKDNLLLYTYRQIADKTGISYATVAETMKILQDADFLRKHKSGYYMVNPGILYKGSYQRRCMALNTYHETAASDGLSTDEIRLQKISKDIARLQRQAKNIQKNMDIAKSDL